MCSYYESIKFLLSFYRQSYTVEDLLDAYPSFSSVPAEKAKPIIRKGFGLIGLKDNWTKEELKSGQIPFRIGRLMPYETRLVEKGETLMPLNKIERANKVLRHLPAPIARAMVRYLAKKY
jgi:hypothetical protein